MQQDSVVVETGQASEQKPKSHHWDKRIASIGFGVAILLAIICFATLMASNQNVKAHDLDESKAVSPR